MTGVPDRPMLLVSVRDACEARAALQGQADIIDVKEPAHGPLGKAETSAIQAIAREVGRRAPLSIALGELAQLRLEDGLALPAGVAFVKAGLAGMAGQDWRGKLDALAGRVGDEAVLVPVAYWDGAAVDAPPVEEVLAWAIARGRTHWLIDTADKAQPGLLQQSGDEAMLQPLLAKARDAGVRTALAGRLTGPRLARAAAFGPAIIGIRSAACENHARLGSVTTQGVRQARAIIHQACVHVASK